MNPRRTRRARRRILPILALLFLVMPLVEIAVIVAVWQAIGPWPTVALLVSASALGAWLVFRGGGRAWRALASALDTGRMPSRELSDAALVLVGGSLLMVPGFVTGAVGLFVVLPPTRPLARRILERVVARRLLAGTVYLGAASATWESPGVTWESPGGPDGPPGAGTTIRGDVVE